MPFAANIEHFFADAGWSRIRRKWDIHDGDAFLIDKLERHAPMAVDPD